MIKTDSPWYKFLIYGLERLGRYYSCYRGFVVDNEDPKKLNRVKVIIPQLDNKNTTGIWAYSKTHWGGKNYGFNIIPEISDMIWVEFEHGDIRYPIWSFASYGLGERPEEFDSPKKYGFKTPAGNIVIIDDTEDEESILVKHKNLEEYILLLKEKIELEALEIYLGKNGEEPAVMGETLKNKLDTVLSALASHTHPVTSAPGVTGPPSNAATYTTVKGELGETLSNKVRLDKD